MCAHCDNQAVVDMIGSRYSKDENLMQLLRFLFFLEASYQFTLSAEHIAGVENELADHLSRNRLADFMRKAKGMNSQPLPIPVSLSQWLLDPQHNQLSPSWIQQFATFVDGKC